MSTPQSPVTSLLAELAAEGTLHSEGAFTLDREKAREKMRQFQLADPLEYLLQLVRAAVLQGATGIDFVVDTDDTWLSFDGKPFTIEDFEELYGALFGRADDPTLAARRHLALGVNAVLALEPRHLRIDSGAVHLVVRPGEEDAFGPLEPAHAKTRIHVRDRFKLTHVGRFFRSARGALPERTLLAARAAYCPVPLTFNTTRLDTGLAELQGRTTTWIELVEGPHRVVGGHRRPVGDPEADEVVLVAAGVSIRTRSLTGRDGFTAVATTEGLRTDVSQADVVQDAVFDALMAVVERARLRSLGALLEAHPDQAPVRLRRELEHAGPPAGWAAHYGEVLAQKLAALPVWPTVGGGLISTDTLVKGDDFSFVNDGLATQFAALQLAPPPPWGGMLLLPSVPLEGDPAPAGWRLFDRWFAGRGQDRTTALGRFLQTERNRRAWQRRLVDQRLPGEAWLARHAFESGEIKGEIGLGPSLADRAILRFAVEGRLLAERVLPCPLLGLEAIIHGPFAPNPLYDELQEDAALEAAFNVLATCLPALLTDLVRRTPYQAADTVRTWLHLACVGEPALIVKTALQGKKALKDAPAAWLRALPESGERLAHVPLFKTSEGHPLTLAELAAIRRGGHTLRHIPAGRPPLRIDPPLVVAEGDDLDLLTAIFGADALDSGMGAYSEAEHRAQWLARAPSFPSVDVHRGTVAGRVVVAVGGFQGEVGLRFDREQRAADGLYRLALQLWVEGRAVSTMAVPCPLPGLVAAIEHPDFKADFAYKEVRVPPGLPARLGPVVAAALRDMIQAPRDEGGTRLRLVRMLIDLVAPTDTHRAVWEGLHRTRSAAQAEARFLDILRAGWGGDPAEVARAIEENPDAPLPAAHAEAIALTEALLGPTFFAAGDASAAEKGSESGGLPRWEAPPLARLLAAVPALGEARVFSTVEGTDVTLNQLVQTEKPLLHGLLARNRPEGYPGPVLLASGPAVAQLRRLLGSDALLSASDWTKASAAARARAALPAHDGRLPREGVFAVHALPGGGEVGLRLPYVPESRVRVVHEGRLVVELAASFEVPVDAVVAAGDLEVTFTASGARLPADTQSVLLQRIEAEVPGLLTSLVAALPHLPTAQAADARTHVRTALVHRMRGKARRAEHLVGDPLVVSLANVELFQEVGGARRSLLEVTRQREAGQPLYLTRAAPATAPAAGTLVLWVQPEEHADLKALFGLALPDYAEAVAAATQDAEFDKQPVVERTLPGALAQVPVEKGPFSGWLGLMGDDRLEVHKRSRLLGTTKLGLGLRGLTAVINDDHADAGGDWTRPQEGPRLDTLRCAVAEQVAALVEAGLASAELGPLRALTWSILQCAVPTARWAELFTTLVREKGPPGVGLYHDALRCLFQDTARPLERLVKPLGFNAEKLMVVEGGPRHGRGDAFVRALFGDWPLAAAGEGILGRLLAQVPVLGRVPLVPTVGGAWRTLAELVAMPAPRRYRLRGGVGLDAEVLVPPPVHWSWLEAVLPGWEEVPAVRVVAPSAPEIVVAPVSPVVPVSPVAPEVLVAPEGLVAPEVPVAPVIPVAPAVPPPQQLLERIREILRGMHLELDLGRVHIAERDGSAPAHPKKHEVVIDLRHPLVQRALHGEDRVWDLFLATAVFGVLNRWLDEVEDHHEAGFVLRIAARLG